MYPKYIKIVSKVEPTYAAVTFASSGGSGGGEASGDDVLFFDAAKIYNVMGGVSEPFMMLFTNSSFINKTTFYAEVSAGRLPFSDAASATGLIDDSMIAYVGVSNSLTPTIVFMGSGGLELPKQEEPVTFYEFLALLNEAGMTLPEDVFKEAEVSREVVEQWMQW